MKNKVSARGNNKAKRRNGLSTVESEEESHDAPLVARLDKCGCHFKFHDLTKRLNDVINGKKQEARSEALLAYQNYYSKNMVEVPAW